MKKGVSPFIAVVLLVAFTLSVAAIFGGWITSFSKSTSQTVEERSSERIECAYGGIALNNLIYNSTSGNLTGTIENTDVITLGDIDLEIFYDNSTKQEIDLNIELSPGEKDTFNQAIDSNYDKVRVFTNCSNVNDEVSSGDISTVS
ncbi:MAG: hypothetical protein B6U88_03295 [Candidatus Aenigmarchaeota archaeon ex4484_56]|nr:MAG: hypothetical protein B6U88_03295 [Candidatus Aenigmarchaeota archaeon ex4484_56]